MGKCPISADCLTAVVAVVAIVVVFAVDLVSTVGKEMCTSFKEQIFLRFKKNLGILQAS